MPQKKEKVISAPLKVPPQNIEAEQAILAGILINNDAMNQIVDVLSPEDFYRQTHMHLFEGMIALYNNGEPIDLITLSQHLNEKNLLHNSPLIVSFTGTAKRIRCRCSVGLKLS